MEWKYVAILLGVVLLPFIAHFLFRAQPGCIEGILTVDEKSRKIYVDSLVLNVRGVFYEGNTLYNGWDLVYELDRYSGEHVKVCYDDERKIEVIEVNGRIFERYEQEWE